jgi:hypothetical protein
MPKYKKLRFLLEIYNGEVVEITNNDNNDAFFLTKLFYRSMLERSINESISFYSLQNYSWLFDDTESRNVFNGVFSSIINSHLFLSYLENYDLAKKDILIPGEDGLYMGASIDDNKSEKLKRYDYDNSRLAVYHYLTSGCLDYLKDFKHFQRNLKGFVDYKVNSFPINVFQIICESLTIERNESSSIEGMLKKLTGKLSKESCIFISGATSFREMDIYENYGLGVYEGGEGGGYDYMNDCHVWEYPSSEEVKIKWEKAENIWNNEFFKILKATSQERQIRFVLIFDDVSSAIE